MFSLSRLLVLASALTLAKGQDTSTLDACAKTCFDNVKNSGSAMGCDAGQPSCLCAKPDFAFGIRDCAQQACSPDIVAQATNFVSALCATATLATVTTTSSPPAAPTATTTTTSTSTDRPTPSSAPQATVESSTATTTTTTSSSSIAPESTQSRSSESTTSVAPAASSDSGDDDQDEDEEEDEEQGGLTVGAKAGIGIAVALLGTGMIGVAFWLLRRRQNRNSISTGEFNISGPMPGSGRDYADSHLDYNKERNTSELELRSRRYEDMLPRQQPTSMI